MMTKKIENILKRKIKIPFICIRYKTRNVCSITGYAINEVIPFNIENSDFLNAVPIKKPYGCRVVPIKHIINRADLDLTKICAQNVKLIKIDNNIQLTLNL